MKRVALTLMLLLPALPFSAPAQKTLSSPAASQKDSKFEKGLLSKLEDEVLAEINLARANPTDYARYLEDLRRKYKGKELKFSDGDVLITNEGVAAVDEAIKFLRSAKPAGPLVVRKGMVSAARDHAADMVKTGTTGHKGSDGSHVKDRLSRYGTWDVSFGENIVYRSRSPRENVMALIIDDGVSNRGHRKNLFNSDFRVIGIAVGKPGKSEEFCVITFAGRYVDKNVPDAKATVPTATKY